MHRSGLTFVASPIGGFQSPYRKCASFSYRIISTGRRPFRASADTDNSQRSIKLPESRPLDLPKPDFAPGEAAAAAQALLDDLTDRPEYYLNISGVLLGIILSFVVLSATVAALEPIPFIPDVLRMIGLSYLFWFLNKFLFSATERGRLSDEISGFVSGVRRANASKPEQVEDT